MVPATSGNFSARLSDNKIAMTASGTHKGFLTEKDILTMDLDGHYSGEVKPSAEAGLHLQIYQNKPEINAVLHTHSRSATQTKKSEERFICLEGYELLKAFEGIETHENAMVVPIVENNQDINGLANSIEEFLHGHETIHAYIIRGHGFYTWASSIEAALRQCEALEFLLRCEST
jgi:methylthioribulose-1-phosphate dehydratase